MSLLRQISAFDLQLKKAEIEEHANGCVLMKYKRDLAKDLKRTNPSPAPMVVAKLPEFRSSLFCCSYHFRAKVEGRGRKQISGVQCLPCTPRPRSQCRNQHGECRPALSSEE